MTDIWVTLQRREFKFQFALQQPSVVPQHNPSVKSAFLSSLILSLRIFFNSETFLYDLKVVTGLQRKVLYSHPCIMLKTHEDYLQSN